MVRLNPTTPNQHGYQRRRIYGSKSQRKHLLLLGAHATGVCPANSVPEGDVLLHAVGQAGLFAGGHGRSGSGNAGFEAVFVDVLDGR